MSNNLLTNTRLQKITDFFCIYMKQFFACFQPIAFTVQEVDSVLNAYSEMYSYCQENFRKYRWNCPTPSRMIDASYPISLTALYPLGKFMFILREFCWISLCPAGCSLQIDSCVKKKNIACNKELGPGIRYCRRLPSLSTQDVNRVYLRRSEDVLDVF